VIAYVAAAVVAASHAAAPPNGATTALAARPLHGSVVLRARPDGPRLVRVGPRGPLGGPLVFGVVGVRDRWVEVTAEALPNGRHGWVEFGRDVSVQPVEWTLRASLSQRELYVLRRGRLVQTIPIAIGAPGSPTPTGHFAVAEKVTGPFGPAYGCCIVALTAHQPHPPSGWNTRITYYVAIHAGSGQGSAVSAGCLHTTDADVRYLMRTVPLGTPVQILK
jgi:L,D-transpeptidase catalytic domain